MKNFGSDTRISTAANVVACDLDGGKALLDLTTSQYYKINPTAALVWEWISGGATLNSLIENMLEEFDVEEGVVRADVEAIISSFADAGLVQVEPSAAHTLS